MEHDLVELTEAELDAVAGGNPFSVNNVVGANVVAQSNFDIGVVAGDFITATFLANIGQTGGANLG